MQEDQSFGDILTQLSDQMTALVRQEVELAKTEVMEKALQAGKYIGFLAIGGVVGYAGFLALIAAAIVLLRKAGVPWWLSTLLVGGGILSVSGLLIWKGIEGLQREDFLPHETIETLEEGAEWAKAQTC